MVLNARPKISPEMLRIAMKPPVIEGYVDVYPGMFDWPSLVLLRCGDWYSEELTHACQTEHRETWAVMKLFEVSKWSI